MRLGCKVYDKNISVSASLYLNAVVTNSISHFPEEKRVKLITLHAVNPDFISRNIQA